jgi:hypothetical protein
VEATTSTDPTFENIVLMLLAHPGMRAPEETATSPAIRAYSIRSCPQVSFTNLSFKMKFCMTEDTAGKYPGQ